MDPFLEDPAFWEGFHHVFITECMYFLSERLPADYVADIGERVELISRSDPAAEQYLPDVAVTREGGDHAAGESAQVGRPQGAVAVAITPVTIPSLDSVEVREGYIEVLRLPDRKLVTSIELLPPWSKFGEGVGEYRHKRRSLVRQGVHVVEIDLLRRGRRTELAAPLPPRHYCAFVFRADHRPDVDMYAWDLKQSLPIIRVPLQSPDSDVLLELSAVVSTAHLRGQYRRKLHYGAAPPGPLSAADAEWANTILRESLREK